MVRLRSLRLEITYLYLHGCMLAGGTPGRPFCPVAMLFLLCQAAELSREVFGGEPPNLGSYVLSRLRFGQLLINHGSSRNCNAQNVVIMFEDADVD